MASSEKKHGESLSLPHNRLAYARYATTYPARLLVRTVADRRGHSPSRLALYRAGKRVGRDAGSGAPSPRMARMACRVARGSPCRGNVLSAVRSAGPAKRKAYRRQPRRRIRRADALRRSVRTRHRTGGPRLHEDGGKVSRSGRAEVAGIRGRPVRRHRLVRQRSPLQMVGTRADSTGSAISASRRSIRSGKRSKERPEESASG